MQVQTECAEVQVYVQEITDRTVPCYYGLRPTRTVVRFVLLLHSIVSWFWHAVVTRLLWYNICRNIRTKFGELQEKSMRAQNIRAHVLCMKRAFSCWVGRVFALCTRFQHGFSMDFEAEYRRQKVRHKDFADFLKPCWKYARAEKIGLLKRCIFSGSKLYFIVLLYFQKYKKTITFSKTFSMLGAPGVYFLYFLSYSWGVSVEWFLVSVLYCWFVCHHTAALVGVRQQNFASCPGGNDLSTSSFETLPSSTRCTFVIFVGAFVAVLWSIGIK